MPFAGSEREGKGLVITGESGGGKTVLLAAWARDRANDHPDDFLFQHYFGSTPQSASVDGFLRRLLGEIKRRFGDKLCFWGTIDEQQTLPFGTPEDVRREEGR